jgi:tripartite-type tricarboxylate transporter receptor subunit TctC
MGFCYTGLEPSSPGNQIRKEIEMKDRVSRRLFLVLLAFALSLAGASVASAQPGEFVKGVLQPLADGFPKRAITLVVVDDPGTRDDLYAKSLQQALSSISPVPVMVSDEPAAFGGTFDKLRELRTREGGLDGYYPVVTDVWGAGTDPLTEPIQKELGMDLSDLRMVTITESISYFWMQRKNPPWGNTFAGLVKYAKENPGKVRYISKEVGTGIDIACSTIQSMAGILDKVKKIPQGTMQEVASTVAAGMGDFCQTYATLAAPHMQAGRAELILSTGFKVPPPYDKDPNIVTLEGAGLPKRQFGAILGFSVPKAVPQAHVDWLYKLIKAGVSTDLHKKREQINPGLIIYVMDPAAAEQAKNQYYEMAEPIVRGLGLHIDQKK